MTTDRGEPIVLYTFGPAWDIPVPTSSPFGLKVCNWMRLHDVPYRMVVENNPSNGPKGKCPWIELRGERLGDSEHIVAAIRREREIPEDKLSARQHAVATTTRLMLEERYHQVWEHQLFIYEGGWKRGYEFWDQMASGIRVLVRTMARGALRKQLIARGVGRHSQSEIVQMGITVLDTIDELLGEGPYFFGDEPSDIDTTVFAFLALTQWTPVQSPVWEHYRTRPQLSEYCERMLARLY